MNEKIGQLDIAIQTLECKKTDRASIETPASTMMTAVFPASTVMTAGLAKQMNDVVFKLDTLTSRVVLLENRVMMLEARLEDESSRSHAFVSQSDNINSKKPPMVPTPRHKVENPIRENDSIYRSKISQKEAFSDDEDETNRERIKRHNSADFDEESYNEASVNEIPVKIIRETSEGAELKTGFMKSLLNRDDSTLISDLSAIDLLDEKEESQIQVHSKEAAFEKETLSDSELKSKYGSNKSAVTNSDLFDAIFSPIRSFSDTKSCTGQGDGSEKKPSNKPQNSEDDRRSSTPTHMALDTSTLDRVSRITQMMAETKQLLH
ncbi:unnamed protein product [Lymnaea stagnalis]|uniref:Uncharacterized protein n=1 Tax=Lymnaea stagnalis TaxID=6523 RepID=A0AAV2HXL0_LYMST